MISTRDAIGELSRDVIWYLQALLLSVQGYLQVMRN